MKGQRNVREAYRDFAKQYLKDNPGTWGKYDQRIPNFWIYKQNGNQIVEVMSYTRFKKIIDAWFIGAKKYIIEGYALALGHRLGRIAGRRVERNHKNRQVNWKASEEKWARTGVRKEPVYWVDEDWVRVGWDKTSAFKNLYLYKFVPAEGNKSGTGFKLEFSQANRKDPDLKLKYKFYPFLD